MTRTWYLMSSHGVVLLHIAQNPDATLRAMSEALDLTERRISQIVQDLAEEDFLSIERVGRRSVYTINESARMQHPALEQVRIKDVLDLVRNQTKS